MWRNCIRIRAMTSLLRPIIIGLILFLSICNQIEARTVRFVCMIYQFLFTWLSQAQNDDDASDVRVKRQYNQYPSNDASDTYIQGSECKGCGPRRDCQCPGKGAMGITGSLNSLWWLAEKYWFFNFFFRSTRFSWCPRWSWS